MNIDELIQKAWIEKNSGYSSVVCTNFEAGFKAAYKTLEQGYMIAGDEFPVELEELGERLDEGETEDIYTWLATPSWTAKAVKINGEVEVVTA